LTQDLPGTGGRLKVEPEDFVVEELPLYEPEGEGPHLYLWVQKRDLPADALLQRIGAVFGGSPRELGQAGTKDRRAVTRQWISALDEAQRWDPAQADPSTIDLGPGVTLLAWRRHRNRLRTGHLAGNRFEILLRDTHPDALPRAQAILDALSRDGMPNFYGEQRFGHQGRNVAAGRAILRRGGARHKDRRAKMQISALQSALFNEALRRRIAAGLLYTALDGDRMQRRDSGGQFEVQDVPEAQARLDARLIVPTGPIFGHKAPRAARAAADLEEAVLRDEGLSFDDFRPLAKIAQGTRRALLVMPTEAEAEAHPQGLRLRFCLPAGSYATVLLDEIMKNDAPDGDADGEELEPEA
jgi:tRNA pseudouridine13 synthase